MSRLTMQEVIEHCERTVQNIEKQHERYQNWIELEPTPISVKRYWEHKQTAEWLKELQHYEDLEEQGRLIDWRKTSEEKPDSTRHLIVADGEIISHYGYYLKPKDKWYKTWECKEEIAEPMYWADMPDPPKESLHSDCCGKMDEVKND